MDSSQNDQITLDFDDNVTITLGDITATDTYSLDPLYGAVPSSNVIWSTGSGQQYPNITVSPNTWTTTGTSGSWTFDDVSMTAPDSGKIHLKGENADIMINDRSLMNILDSIEQRLGLLKCREDLETEWEKLRALGDQYRDMVKNIEEKTKMWDTLKKMPPPEIS